MITQVDILKAYKKFIESKSKKLDVVNFNIKIEEKLVSLFQDIANNRYCHGGYEKFYLYDSKKREIHKASVRDRIVHQLVYDYLVSIYDRIFYFHSYAARREKGIHKAVAAFQKMAYDASRGFTNQVFILKLDVIKFFANIDKARLFQSIKAKAADMQYLKLIEEIIFSYQPHLSAGIPLGNLTSQIFANIYLNELDYFIKQKLNIKHYIRYMDDLLIVSANKGALSDYQRLVDEFLRDELKLELHPSRQWGMSQGVDFLGFVICKHHTVLRPKTKRRMLRLANNRNLPSYLGLLSHCQSYELRKKTILAAKGNGLLQSS